MNAQKEDLINSLTILDKDFKDLPKDIRNKKLAETLLLSVEELEEAGFWGRACSRLVLRNKKLMDTLEEIANEDFRGNRSSASVKAYNVLKNIKEGQEDK